VGKEHSQENIWTNIQKWLLQNKNKQEIYNKLKSLYIATVIKVHRLEWFGQLQEWMVQG
jgi:hypothetical protein